MGNIIYPAILPYRLILTYIHTYIYIFASSTSTTDPPILHHLQVLASVPDGVTLGEVEADLRHALYRYTQRKRRLKTATRGTSALAQRLQEELLLLTHDPFPHRDQRSGRGDGDVGDDADTDLTTTTPRSSSGGGGDDVFACMACGEARSLGINSRNSRNSWVVFRCGHEVHRACCRGPWVTPRGVENRDEMVVMVDDADAGWQPSATHYLPHYGRPRPREVTAGRDSITCPCCGPWVIEDISRPFDLSVWAREGRGTVSTSGEGKDDGTTTWERRALGYLKVRPYGS